MKEVVGISSALDMTALLWLILSPIASMVASVGCTCLWSREFCSMRKKSPAAAMYVLVSQKLQFKGLVVSPFCQSFRPRDSKILFVL